MSWISQNSKYLLIDDDSRQCETAKPAVNSSRVWSAVCFLIMRPSVKNVPMRWEQPSLLVSLESFFGHWNPKLRSQLSGSQNLHTSNTSNQLVGETVPLDRTLPGPTWLFTCCFKFIQHIKTYFVPTIRRTTDESRNLKREIQIHKRRKAFGPGGVSLLHLLKMGNWFNWVR